MASFMFSCCVSSPDSAFLFILDLFSLEVRRDISGPTFRAEVIKKHFLLSLCTKFSSVALGNLVTSFENNQLYAHWDKLMPLFLSFHIYKMKRMEYMVFNIPSHCRFKVLLRTVELKESQLLETFHFSIP